MLKWFGPDSRLSRCTKLNPVEMHWFSFHNSFVSIAANLRRTPCFSTTFVYYISVADRWSRAPQQHSAQYAKRNQKNETPPLCDRTVNNSCLKRHSNVLRTRTWMAKTGNAIVCCEVSPVRFSYSLSLLSLERARAHFASHAIELRCRRARFSFGQHEWRRATAAASKVIVYKITSEQRSAFKLHAPTPTQCIGRNLVFERIFFFLDSAHAKLSRRRIDSCAEIINGMEKRWTR